jgi:hypothetical protein
MRCFGDPATAPARPSYRDQPSASAVRGTAVTWQQRPTESDASIDKHELAARVERLFRLLLAPEIAAVLEGLGWVAGRTVTTLSLGRRNA